MCVELNVCRPQESARKPPLPQYAKTLAAILGAKLRYDKQHKKLTREIKVICIIYNHFGHEI
jgi:hypothetical protein